MKPPPNSPPARRKPGQGLHTRTVPGRRGRQPPEIEDWDLRAAHCSVCGYRNDIAEVSCWRCGADIPLV